MDEATYVRQYPLAFVGSAYRCAEDAEAEETSPGARILIAIWSYGFTVIGCRTQGLDRPLEQAEAMKNVFVLLWVLVHCQKALAV